ncbi:MAG: hypothetical protein JO283_10870 [Bradyrhizobium sp.]|nr:hypothetical protein [Bradyrhizobium sp.]
MPWPREELRQVLEERIRLKPDESGKFLWAEYALGVSALAATAWTVRARRQHDAPVRVLPHIKKLDDCFSYFLVRVTCPCGTSRISSRKRWRA